MASPPPTERCPPDAELAGLIDARLPAAALERLRGHLDRCDACRAAVAALIASGSVAPPAVARPTSEPLPPADPARYERGAELARGGMGRITRAHDRWLGRTVAIKELLVDRDDARARFLREARITARLQHPGVVNLLEAGTWPAGDGFMAMQLVDGRSLGELVAVRPTLADRIGLLPQLIAVADALAYAHSQGVIHRDLKPQNVLVGEFGEAVVIDWGLAKELDDPDEPPAPRPLGDGSGATEAGAVIGTPAFMSPEQARGDALDARSDVYALGALLYYVLAGAPPYTGADARAIVDAVVAGSPPPLAMRAAGAPAELATIAAKAMAHAAADRYASARELAADLKRFQTGQLVASHAYSAGALVRRWVRRHRAAVAVGAVAVAALLALGAIGVRRILAEERRAEAARAVAERRHADAEELLDFLLGDLAAKLAPIGKLELLEAVAAKAVGFYDERREASGPEDRHKLIRALLHHGSVLSQRGDSDAALATSRRALALAEALAAVDPVEPRWRYDVAATSEKLGNVLITRGDAAGALAAFETMARLARGLNAAAPDDAAWQRVLSVAHEKLGVVHAVRGDSAAALAAHREALRLRTALVAADPSDPVRQRDAAVSHQFVGEVLLDRGDVAGAQAEARADLAIVEGLVARDPTNAGLRRDLGVSRERLARTLAEPAPRAAIVELGGARDLLVRLTAEDPLNATWQRDLSRIQDALSDLLLAQGDRAGALREAEASGAISVRLAALHPGDLDLERDVAVTRYKLGLLRQAGGDHAGALGELRAALEVFAAAAARDPDQADRQAEVAEVRGQIGAELAALGDRRAARVELDAALAIATALTARDPAHQGWADLAADLRARTADQRRPARTPGSP